MNGGNRDSEQNLAVAGAGLGLGWGWAGDAMQRMLSQLLQMMYGMSVQTAAGRETLLTAALQISSLQGLQPCSYQLPAVATSPRL